MQSLRYGFEAILSNESTRLTPLAPRSYPQGPGYENVSLANQVCTIVGSASRQLNRDKDASFSLCTDTHTPICGG